MMPQLQLRLRFAFFLSALFFAGVFHLGSSSLITDQDGSLVRQQYGYRAFGSERFALNFIPFTSRFTGQPYDTETGLYYFQSRYYDPDLGRFIQPDSGVPDPGSSQSLNRYAYVLNNPLKYIDPTGHAEEKVSFFEGSGSLGFGSGRNWLGAGWGAGGFLGAGFGRDWLGLGYQAGGFGTMGGHSIMADPFALWDDSPGPIRSSGSSLSFLDKWKVRPAQAFENTLKTAASISLMALPAGGPIARAAAAGRVGATFGVTRMAPIVAKTALPELRISATKYPELAENILHAQKAGHPTGLTHGGEAVVNANRNAALHQPYRNFVPNIGRGLSRDEYPFASSLEGGRGSWVGHIPVAQQQAQGGLIRAMKLKPGDKYRVVIVP